MTKFCTNCGQELEDNVSFCPNCGQGKEEKTAGNNANNRIESNNNVGSKSKIAAGILGILLGAFGIHNFYLGYTNKALAQLLITVLSCGTLSFVSGIWGLIEGIMILTGSINVDGYGNKLSD